MPHLIRKNHGIGLVISITILKIISTFFNSTIPALLQYVHESIGLMSLPIPYIAVIFSALQHQIMGDLEVVRGRHRRVEIHR